MLHSAQISGTGAGVDGCRGGWCCVTLGPAGPSCFVAADISELWRLLPAGALPVLVDMPIGLPSAGCPARECDRQARKILGRRGVTVFAPPCREALGAPDHAAASRLNKAVTGRGLSIQAWGIARRIRELDDFLRERPEAAGKLWEAHPELCFAWLAGKPLLESKHGEAGRRRRLELIEERFPGAADFVRRVLQEYPKKVLQPDDVLDALVLAMASAQGVEGLEMVGDGSTDTAGLPMRIAFPSQ